MIKLDRSSVPFPSSLDKNIETSAINREIVRNQEIIDNHGQIEGAPLDFRAYSQPPVRRSIEKLTNNRCAYCGTKDARNTVQIEHFRPKQELITDRETSIKPGYYWLAAEWGNLLPACQYCNISKNSEVIENNTLVDKKFGKGNYFSVLLEDRASPLLINREAAELALLFDPCIDDPNELFIYVQDNIGGEGYLIVQPNIDMIDPYKIAKAKYSISILGLNHPVLAKKRLDKVIGCSRAIEELKNKLNTNANEDLLKKGTLDILEFVSINRNSSFVGLCRRLATDTVMTARNHLIQNGNINRLEDFDSLESAIDDLEHFIEGYEYSYDIGIIF